MVRRSPCLTLGSLGSIIFRHISRTFPSFELTTMVTCQCQVLLRFTRVICLAAAHVETLVICLWCCQSLGAKTSRWLLREGEGPLHLHRVKYKDGNGCGSRRAVKTKRLKVTASKNTQSVPATLLDRGNRTGLVSKVVLSLETKQRDDLG